MYNKKNAGKKSQKLETKTQTLQILLRQIFPELRFR